MCSSRPLGDFSRINAMRWKSPITPVLLAAVAALVASGRAEAQYGYGAYSPRYNVYTGQPGAGYLGAYGLQRPAFAPGGTTIAFQPLINAITSIPGWYGPAASSHPRRPAHSKVPRDQLLGDDG